MGSGIFILVILLAIGQGMQNGIASEFEQDATNRISVWTGVTSESYKGLNPGRRIRLENSDYEFAEAKNIDKLEYKSAVFSRWGQLTSYKTEKW